MAVLFGLCKSDHPDHLAVDVPVNALKSTINVLYNNGPMLNAFHQMQGPVQLLDIVKVRRIEYVNEQYQSSRFIESMHFPLCNSLVYSNHGRSVSIGVRFAPSTCWCLQANRFASCICRSAFWTFSSRCVSRCCSVVRFSHLAYTLRWLAFTQKTGVGVRDST